MKINIFKKTILAVFALLVASFAQAESALEDILIRGSAQMYTEEFIKIGKKAAARIKDVPDFPISEAEFLQAVQTTTIEFTEDRLVSNEGIEVDALNFPSRKLIRVNWDRWYSYSSNQENRAQLAIHEYLGILKANDTKYFWSMKLMKGFLESVTSCDYMINGAPYYLLYENYSEGAKYLVNIDKVMVSGQGSSVNPLTKESVTISSLNFKWTDLINGNYKNVLNWAIGITWKYEARTLHGRITINQMSDDGPFPMEVFELGIFNSEGIMTPRYIATIHCNTKKMKKE
ncbi:hypothetical protein ACLVWU_12935 [Bdellovibrio sp. HCB290]|uniref:hypothetical protein n=1 Tax=Bdellovibrio sp. HCB290 TaxID=3394356 RepID=UPI0039B4BD66